MKIVILLSIISVLLITACSTKTNIHLYAKYISKEQTSFVINSLDKSLFTVIINQQAFPNSINDNAIVYGPSLNSSERLFILMETLSAQGFPISHASLIAENNHSFTENNVGIFLVPENILIHHVANERFDYKFPLVNEYGAIDCPDATTLYLKGTSNFIIEINQWNNDKEDYIQEYIEGQWRLMDDNILTLKSPSWQKPLLFEKSFFERIEINGKSKGVKFTPMNIVNVSKKAKKINCIYTISLAM
jgi:hypothetical protein